MVVAVAAHKIAYMPVPKSACSSVKAALLQIDPAHPSTVDMDVVHDVFPTRRFHQKNWRDYDDWWRFTVVRDPLRRLLSVYTDRVVNRRELFHSRRLRKQTALPRDPDPDFFFQNLQAYRRLSSSIKHHALPVHLFVGPTPLRYDQVFRVDQLSDLVGALAQRSGTTPDMPRLNRSGAKLSLDSLHPQTQDALAQELKPEYDHLQGFFSNPFAD